MAVVEAALPSIASFPGVQTMEGEHLDNVSARFQVLDDFFPPFAVVLIKFATIFNCDD